MNGAPNLGAISILHCKLQAFNNLILAFRKCGDMKSGFS